MANRQFSKVQSLNKEVKIIAGQFSIAATGGAATKVSGLGYTVAKTGTGLYTITLEDKYPSLLSVCATAQAAVAVDIVAQIKSHDVVSTKTIVVSLNAVATPVEPAAVTVINFVVVLQNSSIDAV